MYVFWRYIFKVQNKEFVYNKCFFILNLLQNDSEKTFFIKYNSWCANFTFCFVFGNFHFLIKHAETKEKFRQTNWALFGWEFSHKHRKGPTRIQAFRWPNRFVPQKVIEISISLIFCLHFRLVFSSNIDKCWKMFCPSMCPKIRPKIQKFRSQRRQIHHDYQNRFGFCHFIRSK